MKTPTLPAKTTDSRLIEMDPASPNPFLRPVGSPEPSRLTQAFDAAPKRPRGPKVLKPVHPNAGIAARYGRSLTKMVDEMSASFQYFLAAAYRKNEPAILAMDATPADELQDAVDELAKRWRKRFDTASERLARYFAKDIHRRSDAVLRKILKDGGFTVEFKMTPAMRDIFNATVEQNVQLIKSIPQQYLTDVQGAVMRSVQTGRDLHSLTKELQERHGVTRRRAVLIAKDQNNKATSAMTRARQTEVGITEAVWMHSHGGNEPRPTHLANNGKRYNIAEGWFDPDPRVRKNIWPGELINCFPADTQINAALNVEIAYRHWFDGELAVLVTASGKTLRATVNHPVLTPSGWRAVGLLNEGDEIIEVSSQGVDAVMPEFDKNEAVPTIGEIFIALKESASVEAKVALGANFHGDRANGNVDVVFAARPLTFGRETAPSQRIQEFGFTQPDHAGPNLGASPQFLGGSFDAADRVVRSGCDPKAFLGGSSSHSHQRSLASVADGSADALDPSLDGLALVSELLGQGKQASTPLVHGAKISRIVRVERRAFAGHVYNLQTQSGWYAAEGVTVHNCKCVSRAVVKGFS